GRHHRGVRPEGGGDGRDGLAEPPGAVLQRAGRAARGPGRAQRRGRVDPLRRGLPAGVPAGERGAVVKPVIVTGPPRADRQAVAELGKLGVATVHEAAGKTGLLGPDLRPAWPGASAAGTAVTALCGPGDNLMVHAAIEQAEPGDLLVITTTSPCSDGYVGELIVTSLLARGVTGLVTTTGIRDVAAITTAGF